MIYYTDLDEFLDCDNIKDFLSTIDRSVEQIQFKNMNVCNNNLLYPDYTKSPFDLFREPCQCQCFSIKSMVRTSAKSVIFVSPHYFLRDVSHSILANGQPSSPQYKTAFKRGQVDLKRDYSDRNMIYHCDVKTIQEYIDNKFNRTDAVYNDKEILCSLMKPIPDRAFFRFTKRTKERLEILSKAEPNGIVDIFLSSPDEVRNSLLDKYRIVYIKGCGTNISKRIRFTNNVPPYKIMDVAEFYVEDGIEKRKSLEQLKNGYYE